MTSRLTIVDVLRIVESHFCYQTNVEARPRILSTAFSIDNADPAFHFCINPTGRSAPQYQIQNWSSTMETSTTSPSSTLRGPEGDHDLDLLIQSGMTRVTTEDADSINETPLVPPDSLATESLIDDLTSRTERRTSPRQHSGASRHAKSASPSARDLHGRRWSPQFPSSANSQGDEEEALASDIGDLWGSDQVRSHEIRRSSKERSDIRIKLAERLHRYKALLVGSGRSGKWSGFLREIEMPRATADRYVQRWERSLQSAKGNCLTESISAPTADEITRIVARLKPRLKRVLTTKDAVEQFLSVLAGSLQLP